MDREGDEQQVRPLQAGLFDRRAERAQEAVVAADQAGAALRAQQVAMLERARQLHHLAPQLLLVLSP